jgi:chemotaxis response regulator CheB
MTRLPASATDSTRHRVVIIGAVFGGLFAARALLTGLAGRLARLVVHSHLPHRVQEQVGDASQLGTALIGRGRAQRTITERQSLAGVQALERPRATDQRAA